MNAVSTFVRERYNMVGDDIGDIVSCIFHATDSIIIAEYKSISEIESIITSAKPRYTDNNFYTAIDDVYKLLQN